MAKATQTVKTSTTTKTKTTVAVKSGNSSGSKQSRCPTCGKYMRKK